MLALPLNSGLAGLHRIRSRNLGESRTSDFRVNVALLSGAKLSHSTRNLFKWRAISVKDAHLSLLFSAMCGIVAVHGLEKARRAHFVALSRRVRHRGPDWSGRYVGKDAVLCHERLAIVGVGAWFSSL